MIYSWGSPHSQTSTPMRVSLWLLLALLRDERGVARTVAYTLGGVVSEHLMETAKAAASLLLARSCC